MGNRNPDLYELTYLLDFFRFFALMSSYFTREQNWFETVFCLPLIITGLHHILAAELPWLSSRS